MKWLEDELRYQLQRKEPPEGFAERVLARMQAEPCRLRAPVRRARLLSGKRWVGWVAAAACLVSAITFVQHRHYQHQRAEADLASRQANIGLRIASAEIRSALHQARQVTEQGLL